MASSTYVLDIGCRIVDVDPDGSRCIICADEIYLWAGQVQFFNKVDGKIIPHRGNPLMLCGSCRDELKERIAKNE